jgi:DNA-binding MarR family transcriptional regulator
MAADRNDVQAMVVALFTVIAGVERARRQKKAAAALDLLQIIGTAEGMRPSDLADQRSVHRSLVTRQLRELEESGYVQFAEDPRDGRSWLVSLTPAGQDEMLRLQQVGLDRFGLFVADWRPDEVRQLTSLLAKLTASMSAVTGAEGQTARASLRPRSRTSRREKAGLR